MRAEYDFSGGVPGEFAKEHGRQPRRDAGPEGANAPKRLA